MSEEKKPHNLGLMPALPITVVLTVLAGLFFTQSPYQSERPSIDTSHIYQGVEKKVYARLWQDPFVATNDDKNKETDNCVQNNCSDCLKLALSNNGAEKILLLAVTLPGGPYQEASEQRMRWRYAVLSGLANQEAYPHDASRISYFYHNFENQNKPQIVPYEEWFLETNKTHLVLLWIDENYLLKNPHANLKQLLIRFSLSQTLTNIKKISYKVIGPNSSALLRNMVSEFKCNSNSPLTEKELSDHCKQPVFYNGIKTINDKDIKYFSAAATASMEELEISCKDDLDLDIFTELNLHRTTPTDDLMINIILDELSLRKLNQKVIILSEWDTFYARSMNKTFERAWSRHFKDTTKESISFFSRLLKITLIPSAATPFFNLFLGLEARSALKLQF